MTISAPLARSLAAARPMLNARVAAARHAKPAFDTAVFAEMLQTRLDPVVAAVEALAPDRVGAVVDAGFDILLVLAGRGRSATQGEAVEQLWREVLPCLAGAVARQPFATMGALTNAAINIAGTPGARVEEWLELMAALGPMVDEQTLPGAGQIVAWRSGLAHFRAGALEVADTLPEAVALAATGTSGRWADVRAGFATSPWWAPDAERVARAAAHGVSFGAFAGFGGSFPSPPEVAATAEGFVVRSGGRDSLLIVDLYGATLHAASDRAYDEAIAAPPGEAVRIEGQRVTFGDRTVTLDLPAQGLTAVANADSAAIASPYSHRLRLFPWRSP